MARDRDALLLAAGKLRRKVIEPVRQTDKLQRRLRGHGVRGDLRHKFTFSRTVSLGMRL